MSVAPLDPIDWPCPSTFEQSTTGNPSLNDS